MDTHDKLQRPYLVIPKLIEQPTWGGQYIVTTKGWAKRDNLGELKIGQSYELFSGSNLSLLDTSDDPQFTGELADRDAVEVPTHPEGSLHLADLVAENPEAVLGAEVVSERGPEMALLIKYTQALGNSFQVHIKDGVQHPTWKPKPESWYYFEPGLITLGVKPDIDWQAYEQVVEVVQQKMFELGQAVSAGSLSYDDAQAEIKQLLKEHDPWQFVNTVPVAKDQLVDLSSGGIHHSWEEDATQAPLGNVLYELQAEAMDRISTFRSFDKGKMGRDGSVRQIHIKDYFDAIDRSDELNDPAGHIVTPQLKTETPAYKLEHLLDTRHYQMDKLTLHASNATYEEHISRYKHLFVKDGRVTVTAGGHTVTVTTAHACFIPASAKSYTVASQADHSEILISY